MNDISASNISENNVFSTDTSDTSPTASATEAMMNHSAQSTAGQSQSSQLSQASQVSQASQTSQNYRYCPELAVAIEKKWQQRWEETGAFYAPNIDGDLQGPIRGEKMFIMDMFPYPSGAGLHVGHPFGFIATDVYARYQRMLGKTVLHTMGFDTFGLPAEQYAIQVGIHPDVSTKANIDNFLAQITAIGLGHDSRRRISTTDPEYYRWTQWIFSRIYDSWFDPEAQAARPISQLREKLLSGHIKHRDGKNFAKLSPAEQEKYINSFRLVYQGESVVNWCPGLGTVLAAEEVTSDGKSERGNFPVFRKPMKQWMMRITAYANRLLDDLALLDWPEKIITMQRNWIGKSEGALVNFAVADTVEDITVFTTRPDTLYGVTYLVISPQHRLLDSIVPQQWDNNTPQAWRTADTPSEAIRRYQDSISDTVDPAAKEKTGQFTGAYAIHPLTGQWLPIFISDYVLADYGTGALMAVPAHDQRDYDFAQLFDLPIRSVIAEQAPSAQEAKGVFTGEGIVQDSEEFSGQDSATVKKLITQKIKQLGVGEYHCEYHLRDWVFARQRYWGEPFPIVYDEHDVPHLLPDDQLPLLLPEIDDFRPITFDPHDSQSLPTAPLAKNQDWVNVTLDLGNGPQHYRRETDTMPNWAGSCCYYLRYIDPHNTEVIASPANEQFWMIGVNATHPITDFDRASIDNSGVDLYVGGAEHAVLHNLYSRFWHKILYDLGYVSTPEPFHKLFNQGMLQAYAYTDNRGAYVPAEEVIERDGEFYYHDSKVNQEFGKIGKSLKNAISPDDICQNWGADTFRLYEMSIGPLDQSTVWSTKDIVGSHRFLQRLWRLVFNERTGESIVSDQEISAELKVVLAQTILGVRDDYDAMRFNTAVAKIIQLTNYLTKHYPQGAPRAAVEIVVRLISPLAPHIAAELWEKLGYNDSDNSIVYQPFPVADPKDAEVTTVEIPIQVNGKIKTKLVVDKNLDASTLEAFVLRDEKIQSLIRAEINARNNAQNNTENNVELDEVNAGVNKEINAEVYQGPKKIIAVPGKLVNIVL